MPVSPLARTPSPTTSSPCHSHQARSTSPLTLRASPGSPHFVTVTSTSPRPGSPLLRRALSPESFHTLGKPEGPRQSKERSRRISVDHCRGIKSDSKVQRSRSLREECSTGGTKLAMRPFEQERLSVGKNLTPAADDKSRTKSDMGKLQTDSSLKSKKGC